MCDLKGIGLVDMCPDGLELLEHVIRLRKELDGLDRMDPRWVLYEQALEEYNNHLKEK